MDALTRFKADFDRGQATPAPSRTDAVRRAPADTSLHRAAARLRPPPTSADDDDWDAAIARAKLRAEMPPTPPPTRQAPAQTLAALNALVRSRPAARSRSSSRT